MTFDEKVNIADLVIKILGASGAGIAFLFGYNQYKKGQRWQKAQILLSLVDSFENDKLIERACQMLDWDEREVLISDGQSIPFKNEMLLSALRTPFLDTTSIGLGEGDGGFSHHESIIRDCFDAFFDFFHKLYTFKRNGLLNFKDLTYFYYWFELIRNIGKYKEDPKIQKMIFNYIEIYNFVGVKELLEEYAQNPDPLLLTKAKNAKKIDA